MDRSPRPRTPAPTRPGPPPARARRVHIVEGDEDFARELARALEAQGMVARVIGTGKEALAAAEAARPDLIVLCAELPDVSGYAVCSRLKRNRETAAIPVILTSGCEDTESFWSHQRLWVRAEAYLRKPFDPAPLAALLRPAALTGRARARGASATPTATAIVTEAATTAATANAAAKEIAPAPERPGTAAQRRAPRGGASDEILEDGFEYVGGGDAEVLEDGFVYLGGGAEPEPLEDGLVQVVAPRPAAAPPAPDEVLEDGFVYLGGGAEPQTLDDATVYLTGLEAAVGGAARTAPGRWTLPAGLGAAA